MNLFGVVFPKLRSKKLIPGICIPNTKNDIHRFLEPMSLLLNSALLKIRIPALAFNCLYAITVMNSATNCGIRLHLLIQLKFCGNHLQIEHSYICLLRNPRNNKCAEKIYVTLICTRNPLNFLYVESTYILEHVED